MKMKKWLAGGVSFLLTGSVFLSAACAAKTPEKQTEEGVKKTSIALAENGESRYKIVIPENCAMVIRTGANEIAAYLNKATGAEIPVVAESETGELNNDDYVISVGETTLKEKNGITVTDDEVTFDGYKIVRKENVVFIAGPTDRATVFGCFEFLKKEIGYEVYTADEIDYETYDTLYLKDFDLADAPSFESRHIDGLASLDEETGFRLRLNQMFAYGSEKFGYSKRGNYIPDADHNTNTIISKEKYPQYFTGGSTQICFTQKGIADAYITELIEDIQNNPKGYIVNVSQEDGKNFCQCDTCKDETASYGVSGLWIRFLNKIIDGIETWKAENCPERRLDYTSYFYGDTFNAPVDVLADGSFRVKDESCIPHKKLSVRLTQANCALHSVDDPDCASNARQWLQYKAWRSICSNFAIWDYAANYRNYLPFYNDINSIKRNKEIYREMNVRDLNTEFNSGSTLTQFGYLRLFLHAKVMWNVDEDVEQLTNGFFKHYYKDVAPEMRAIYDMYRTHFAVLDSNHKFTVNDLMEYNTTVFPKNVIERAQELIDQAIEKCDKIENIALSEKLKKRVYDERACVWFLKLYLFDEYGYDSEEYTPLFKAFEQEMVQLGMPRYAEHTSMESWLNTKRK